MTLNSSLLQWLATFELDGRPSIDLTLPSEDDVYSTLADGYVCARILNQLSPQHFPDDWLDGIKPVPPNGSWLLRCSNLKRILKKIYDYASALQDPKFKPSAITPDVVVIAQNFKADQISRLIQLILFCSINCDKRQDYIPRIHNLPKQVQQDIKNAIEELMIKNNDSFNQKLYTSHVGNDSVNSESNIDTTSNSANKYNQNMLQSTPTRSSAYRANMRRDSSQMSSDLSKSHLDTSTQSAHDYSHETIEDIRQRLSSALAIKDEKSQACHELELRIKQLQLEKDQLIYENERLANEKSSTKVISNPKRVSESTRQLQLSRDIDLTGSSEAVSGPRNLDEDDSQNLIWQQNKRLQNEMHRLKEQLIKVETEKEDYRLKSSLLKEDLEKMTLKRDEFRNKAEQAKRLQDELDEHRHISEKVTSYETMMDNLVKKNNDMKKELKSLEEKNLSHIHRIVMLEEENKQLLNKASQIEIYKNQLIEAQVKLSEETHRADEVEAELTRLSEKYSAAKKENEKLFETAHQLIGRGVGTGPKDNQKQGVSNNELLIRDLDSGNLKGSNSTEQTKYMNKPLYGLGDTENQGDNDALSSMSTSVIELKERLARLEYENELLQNKLNSKKENDHTVLSGLLENSNAKCTKLEHENRQSRKKILLLESQLKDLINANNGASTSTATMKDSSSDNTMALMNRVEELQRALFQKEQELMDSETKYKRNLQKAKDVIKTLNNSQSIIGGSLHPSCMSSASPFNSSSLDETNLLKQQLRDREERLIEMEREFYEFKKFKEIHERLIISAFYGLTTPMQWRNAEKRLERTTLTSPPNTASSSINHSKHSH